MPDSKISFLGATITPENKIIMFNDSLQQNKINVKRLGAFFPVDEDKALQGCNLSAYAGSPFGESVPFSLYPQGRVQSDKPTVLSSNEFCNVDSHSPEDSVLQFINRHISASEVFKRKALVDSYLEFLESHNSLSDPEREFRIDVF